MSDIRPPFYKRKYLLNPRFQLKYTFIFLLLASLVAGVLGNLLYQTVRENSQLIRMDNAEANEAIQMMLTQQDLQVLYRIFGLLGGMVFMITVLGIFLTHQIAGPALVMTRYLGEMAEGRLPKLRPLRTNDELRDLFQSLETLVSNRRAELGREVTLLDGLRAHATPEQKVALDSAIAAKKAALES